MCLYYQELMGNALQGGGESCPGGRGEAEQRGGAEAEAQEAREGVLPAHGEVQFLVTFVCSLVTIDDN